MTNKFDPGAANRLISPERVAEERPRVLLQSLGLTSGQVILDLACGSGFYLPYLAKQVGHAGRVVGADLQRRMLQVAQEYLRNLGIHNVYLVQVGEVVLPFPDQVFDVTILAHALHELQHPRQSLQEIRRVLKSSGVLWIWDWDRAYPGPPGPPQEERLTPEEAQRLLEDTGFFAELHPSLLPARFFIQARLKPMQGG